jgi:uncharacterized protein involved in exopolysaccharide biosynthesis
MNTEQTNLSLVQVLGILRRCMSWILLCFVRVVAAAYGLAALASKERFGTADLALQDRTQSRGTLAELRNDNVEVAHPAVVPMLPSSPKTWTNTPLGAVLGLLLGLGVAFLMARSSRRITEPKDLETIYGLPMFGVVPESTVLSRCARSKKHAGEALPASEAKAMQAEARVREYSWARNRARYLAPLQPKIAP